MIRLDSWAGLTRLGHLIERLIPADTNDIFPEESVMPRPPMYVGYDVTTEQRREEVILKIGTGGTTFVEVALMQAAALQLRDDLAHDADAADSYLARHRVATMQAGSRHVPPGVVSEHPLQPGGAA